MQLEIPNIPQRRKKIRRTMPQRKRMKTTMKTSSYLMSMTTAPVILGSSSLRLAGLIVITANVILSQNKFLVESFLPYSAQLKFNII